jgi:hypothetical protein
MTCIRTVPVKPEFKEKPALLPVLEGAAGEVLVALAATEEALP